jgi:hypothetical protein
LAASVPPALGANGRASSSIVLMAPPSAPEQQREQHRRPGSTVALSPAARRRWSCVGVWGLSPLLLSLCSLFRFV